MTGRGKGGQKARTKQTRRASKAAAKPIVSPPRRASEAVAVISDELMVSLADARSENESLRRRLKTIQEVADCRFRKLERLQADYHELRKERDKLQTALGCVQGKPAEPRTTKQLMFALAGATTAIEVRNALVSIISSTKHDEIPIELLTAAGKMAKDAIGEAKWPAVLFRDAINTVAAAKKK